MQHFCNHGYILKDVFHEYFLGTYNFFDLGCYRKRHGSVLFLLEVFSLNNEGVMAVFPKIKFMTSRDRKCVGGPRKW